MHIDSEHVAGGHDHEHEHTHTHEHTHDGVAHTHPHTHEHTHDHEHTHEHEHSHEHCDPKACAGCADCADPKAELAALMKYMVNHNAAHANELAGLAGKLKEMGDSTGYEQVMAAVSDFEKGNMRLSAVLAAMNVPQK